MKLKTGVGASLLVVALVGYVAFGAGRSNAPPSKENPRSPTEQRVQSSPDLLAQELATVPEGATVELTEEQAPEIYQAFRSHIGKKFDVRSTNVGENGGFALPSKDVRMVLDTILESAKELGYEKQVKFGLIVAASHIRRKGLYHVEEKPLTHRQMVNYYANLVADYPVSMIEDPFAEDDIPGFQGLMSRIGSTHPIVGDDLLVSSPSRIKRRNT